MDIIRDVNLQADERLDDINEGLRIIQKKNGLTFGTDAFLLASFVRSAPDALCVDLGGGTGILSLLLLAKNKVARTVSVEVQSAFASLASRNAQLNGLSARMLSLCGDVRTLTQVSLGAALEREMGQCADVVVCNPPYMRTGNGARNAHDEKYLARHEVCGGVADFCAAAARILRHGGAFYVVFRPDRLSVLLQALHDNHLEPKCMVMVHADAQAEPSSVIIEARAGGAEGLRVLPPLLLHEYDSRGCRVRPLTKPAQTIYDTMSWYTEG